MVEEVILKNLHPLRLLIFADTEQTHRFNRLAAANLSFLANVVRRIKSLNHFQGEVKLVA